MDRLVPVVAVLLLCCFLHCRFINNVIKCSYFKVLHPTVISPNNINSRSQSYSQCYR